ncbi:Protein BOBBER 1 [Phytophthora citrophthora]|uniref:Protein BOBBER 1 n=1 Tax=Phytophthora citrophthora TaxID=4793 RepID=A0AAD9GVC7_9STRA|nr:Protein BOBBER 1 [Phytophthora citrophthora]
METDFYVVSSDPGRHKMGFLPGQAQQKVLKAFQKYPLKSLDGSGDGVAAVNTALNTTAPTVSASVDTSKRSVSVLEDSKPQLTEDGKQVPVGNGGVAANYTWTQTLEDVSIQMEVQPGTKAKDLICRIEASKVFVALKSDPTKPLLEGEFPDKIRADESIWSLESNHMLNISLEKIKQTWWASALKGGPEIDTSQVDSRRNIQEYDEVTQGAIRKAVYDQRQQMSGGVHLTAEEKMLEDAKNLPGSPFLPPTQKNP